jgi:hypothetical protein
MFEPPINSAWIQSKFVSWIFISNSIGNLNFLPNVKLFVRIVSFTLQILENFGVKEVPFLYFTNLTQYEIMAKHLKQAIGPSPRATV